MRVCPACFALYGPDQQACPKDRHATVDHTEVLIGLQLGPYVVRSMVSEGGMGVVYAGEHPALGRRVALKVLRPELSLRDDIVERFIQEARAVNTIGHSNIVSIYDFGRTPFGSFYIVMEYLDGRTAARVVEEGGPQSLDRVRFVVHQVGQALAAAHAKGIVHRDVKPENIMIGTRGTQEYVKLLDFGIAKLMTEQPRERGHTAGAMGTPQYMSPEQLEDAEVDERTDVYALGVVAYELLTGRVPYPGATHAAVRQLQLTQAPPPPSLVRRDLRVPRGIDAAILTAMHPDPESRFPHLLDFLAAFEHAYSEGLQSPPPDAMRPSAPTASRFVRWVLPAFLLTGSVGAIVAIKLRGRKEPQYSASHGTDGAVRRPERGDAQVAAAPTVVLPRALVDGAFASDRAETRAKIAALLAERRLPIMVPELRRAVADRHPDVRRQAALALAAVGARDAETLRELRRVLDEPLNTFVAVDVAQALAQLGDRRGRDYLRHALKASQRPQDRAYRKALLEALGRLRDPAAVAWKGYLDGTNPSLERRALGYLSGLGAAPAAADARARLLRHLNQGDWESRLGAAEALAPHAPRPAQAVFEAALRQGGAVGQRAAVALAHLGDSRGAPLLLESLSSSDAELAAASALALSHLLDAPRGMRDAGVGQGTQPRRAGDASPAPHDAALRAKAAQHLTAALEAREEVVRLAAAVALLKR
ncbi:MAG: protein kinase [Deltaproteobacteria bacterium]|nr:protein kinase [Deltaproteobacteria bacterium]